MCSNCLWRCAKSEESILFFFHIFISLFPPIEVVIALMFKLMIWYVSEFDVYWKISKSCFDDLNVIKGFVIDIYEEVASAFVCLLLSHCLRLFLQNLLKYFVLNNCVNDGESCNDFSKFTSICRLVFFCSSYLIRPFYTLSSFTGISLC